MKLGLLMHDVLPADPAWAELEISGVQDDSRLAAPGVLFVAVPGLTVDGHDYAPAAVEAGASAVLAARPLPLPVPCLVVADPARALSLVAARLAGEPAAGLQLFGITGTNGKTTTTYLIESILAAAGRRPGVIGTVSYRYGGQQEKAPFTTPTPLLLQQLLARMRDAGCSDVVAEVSSHALQLGRVWGLSFAVAAFTHLTQDHLDLHGSMEAYLRAKLLLFSRHLRAGGTAVVNVDGCGADEVMQVVTGRDDVRLWRCSTQGQPAEVVLRDCRFSIDGLAALLDSPLGQIPLRSPLLGAYNADNILLAAASCLAGGVSLEPVAAGIAAVTGVPGRLERVDAGGELAVLVDYAHTPDALARAIDVLRPLCRGRLIVVFGCGGDRDRSKRPLMGQAVARGADLAVVTSDNPRTEDPQAIIDAILEGMSSGTLPRLAALTTARGYLVQPDRRQAIHEAVAAARAGDIVLVAGKGHEDYQILGKQRIHFDDREVAREALA